MTRPSFALPDRLDPEDLRSRCLPPLSTYPMKMPRRTFFYQTGGASLGSSQRSIDVQPSTHKESLAQKLVLRITTHFGVCPCVVRGLAHCAENSNIPWNRPTISSSPDCRSIAEVPSFTLRTALSAMPFVLDRQGVERTVNSQEPWEKYGRHQPGQGPVPCRQAPQSKTQGTDRPKAPAPATPTKALTSSSRLPSVQILV